MTGSGKPLIRITPGYRAVLRASACSAKDVINNYFIGNQTSAEQTLYPSRLAAGLLFAAACINLQSESFLRATGRAPIQQRTSHILLRLSSRPQRETAQQ